MSDGTVRIQTYTCMYSNSLPLASFQGLPTFCSWLVMTITHGRERAGKNKEGLRAFIMWMLTDPGPAELTESLLPHCRFECFTTSPDSRHSLGKCRNLFAVGPHPPTSTRHHSHDESHYPVLPLFHLMHTQPEEQRVYMRRKHLVICRSAYLQ